MTPLLPKSLRLRLLMIITTSLVATACGSEEASETESNTIEEGVHEVSIEGFTFSPTSLTISVGDTVRWTNNDTAVHTSTSGTPGAPDETWDSSSLSSGDRFEFTFSDAGSFNYFCTIHPNMLGAITVE